MSRVVERERERQAVERINKKLTPRVIVKIGIGLLVLVAVLLGAVSFQYVWYRTTVFREQNQPSYKPQEVASPATLAGTIPITGEEPIVNTRAGARLLENPIIPNAETRGTICVGLAEPVRAIVERRTVVYVQPRREHQTTSDTVANLAEDVRHEPGPIL